MYAPLPLSPRKARHFPPSAGEANAKEERNYSFLIKGINCLPVILERSEESRQRMQVVNAFCDNLCRILTAPVGRVWRLIAF